MKCMYLPQMRLNSSKISSRSHFALDFVSNSLERSHLDANTKRLKVSFFSYTTLYKFIILSNTICSIVCLSLLSSTNMQRILRGSICISALQKLHLIVRRVCSLPSRQLFFPLLSCSYISLFLRLPFRNPIDVLSSRRIIRRLSTSRRKNTRK